MHTAHTAGGIHAGQAPTRCRTPRWPPHDPRARTHAAWGVVCTAPYRRTHCTAPYGRSVPAAERLVDARHDCQQLVHLLVGQLRHDVRQEQQLVRVGLPGQGPRGAWAGKGTLLAAARRRRVLKAGGKQRRTYTSRRGVLVACHAVVIRAHVEGTGPSCSPHCARRPCRPLRARGGAPVALHTLAADPLARQLASSKGLMMALRNLPCSNGGGSGGQHKRKACVDGGSPAWAGGLSQRAQQQQHLLAHDRVGMTHVIGPQNVERPAHHVVKPVHNPNHVPPRSNIQRQLSP